MPWHTCGTSGVEIDYPCLVRFFDLDLGGKNEHEVTMPVSRVYSEIAEVQTRLAEFGVTKEELLDIVRAAAGAKGDAVPHDPITAAGTFAYIYGTRHMRNVFAPKGWIPKNTSNIESIDHPETGTKLIYQNVDSACDPLREPKAISSKGAASERMVSSYMGFLFPDMEREYTAQLNDTLWYLCVYANGDDVAAELSRPLAVEEGQITGFSERIFLLRKGEWINPKFVQDDDLSSGIDFDVKVSRK